MVDWSGGAIGPGIGSDRSGSLAGARQGTSIDDIGAWYAENIDPNLSQASTGTNLAELMAASQTEGELQANLASILGTMGQGGLNQDYGKLSGVLGDTIGLHSDEDAAAVVEGDRQHAIAVAQALAAQKAPFNQQLDSFAQVLGKTAQTLNTQDMQAFDAAVKSGTSDAGPLGTAGLGGLTQNVGGKLGLHNAANLAAMSTQKGPPVGGTTPGVSGAAPGSVLTMPDTTPSSYEGSQMGSSYSGLTAQNINPNDYSLDDHVGGYTPASLALGPPGYGFVSSQPGISPGPPGYGFLSSQQGSSLPGDIDGGGGERRRRNRTPDYAAYVDMYDDLLAAQPGNMSKADWGRRHWERHGGQEGRRFGPAGMPMVSGPRPGPGDYFSSGPNVAIADPRPANPVEYGNAFQGVRRPTKTRRLSPQEAGGWA